MDKKAYALASKNLFWDAMTLAGRIAESIPQEIDLEAEFAKARGNQWDNDALMQVSKAIELVQYRFDQIQHILGLPDPGAARFGNAPAPKGE